MLCGGLFCEKKKKTTPECEGPSSSYACPELYVSVLLAALSWVTLLATPPQDLRGITPHLSRLTYHTTSHHPPIDSRPQFKRDASPPQFTHSHREFTPRAIHSQSHLLLENSLLEKNTN